MTPTNSCIAIVEQLNKLDIDHHILRHDPVFTMEDVESILDIPREARIKTLVVSIKHRDGAQPVLCGIRSDSRLDYGKVAKALQVSRSKLVMLGPDAVEAKLGLPLGAIGLVLPTGLPTVLLSSNFTSQETVYFGAGRNDRTVAASLRDLLAHSNVNIADLEK